MADLNKQSLEMWNAMKPMVDREIDQQTKGAVQRRKAKVTTAPSLVTKKIGVTEPFGDQYFIPYDAKVAGAKVGDVVWVEYMYGASNAFASMYAKAVEDPRSCSATLSSPGWYRVIHYDSPSGSDSFGKQSFIIELYITRGYATTSNETHKITLNAPYNKITFTNENSVSNVLGIDKIRYTRTPGTGNAYVDIHYNLSVAEVVTVDYSIKIRPDFQQYFTAESMQSVADAPAGETVLTTYTFAANGNNLLKTLLVDSTISSGYVSATDPSIASNSRLMATPFYGSSGYLFPFVCITGSSPIPNTCTIYIRNMDGTTPADESKVKIMLLVDNR